MFRTGIMNPITQGSVPIKELNPEEIKKEKDEERVKEKKKKEKKKEKEDTGTFVDNIVQIVFVRSYKKYNLNG